MPSDSSKEVLVYALLDSQNDSSFIVEEVANDLDVSETETVNNVIKRDNCTL